MIFRSQLNETTRSFFAQTARLQEPKVAADFTAVAQTPPDPAAVTRLSQSAYYNALLRTTCVATLLQGGHAPNALPQTARANVNCRMLPTDSIANVQATLKKVVADDQISVTVANESGAAPPSPINPAIMRQLESLSSKLYGGIPVVPIMDTGASDGKFLRLAGIPTYGVPGVFEDIDDVRAHGRDERIGVKDFYDRRGLLLSVHQEPGQRVVLQQLRRTPGLRGTLLCRLYSACRVSSSRDEFFVDAQVRAPHRVKRISQIPDRVDRAASSPLLQSAFVSGKLPQNARRCALRRFRAVSLRSFAGSELLRLLTMSGISFTD